MLNDKLLVKCTKSPHAGRVITCSETGGARVMAGELADGDRGDFAADPEVEAELPEAVIGGVVGEFAASCCKSLTSGVSLERALIMDEFWRAPIRSFGNPNPS